MSTKDWLRRRIADLEAENAKLREKLARAKNPDPVQRPNFDRVRRLARNACMEVVRHKNGGWVLEFGKLKRWYKRLKDLWELLTSDDWKISDVFSKIVLPPVRRRRPKVRDRNPSLAPDVRVKPQWWHGDRIPFS